MRKREQRLEKSNQWRPRYVYVEQTRPLEHGSDVDKSATFYLPTLSNQYTLTLNVTRLTLLIVAFAQPASLSLVYVEPIVDYSGFVGLVRRPASTVIGLSVFC